MTAIYDRHIDHPGAWKASDFKSKDDYAFDFTKRHIDTLDDALSRVKSRG